MYKRTITMSAPLSLVIAAAILAGCIYGICTFLTGKPPAIVRTPINYNVCAVCGRNFADVLGSPWTPHLIFVNANVNQNEADEGLHIQFGTGVYCEHCSVLHSTTPERYTLYKACVQRVKDQIADTDLNRYDQYLDQEARFLAACRKEIYGNDSITASPFTPPVPGLPPASQPQINPVPIRPEGQKTIFKYSNPMTPKPAEVPQKTWDKKIGDQTLFNLDNSINFHEDFRDHQIHSDHEIEDTTRQRLVKALREHDKNLATYWRDKYKSLEPQPKPTDPLDLPTFPKPPLPPIDTHKSMEDGTPAPDYAKLQHDYDLREADKAAMAAWDNQPVHDFRGPDAPWLRQQKK